MYMSVALLGFTIDDWGTVASMRQGVPSTSPDTEQE